MMDYTGTNPTDWLLLSIVDLQEAGPPDDHLQKAGSLK